MSLDSRAAMALQTLSSERGMVEGEVKLVSLGNLNYSMWISCDLIDN